MVKVTSPPTPTGRRFFTPEQLAQVAALLEAFWPSGQSSPGAREAGAADYLDQLLGSDDSIYYEISKWRQLYTANLPLLDAAALHGPAGKPLQQLTVDEVTSLLQNLSKGALLGFPDAKTQTDLFGMLRAHAIEGCLSDPRWGGNQNHVIWDWLGYPRGRAAKI